MATAPDAQKAIPSQENLLLDYVRRLEKHRGGRQVVHVHLSGANSISGPRPPASIP